MQVTRKDIELTEAVVRNGCSSIVRTTDEGTKKHLLLVDGHTISVISIAIHSSLRIYLLCETTADLLCLRELFDSSELLHILTIKMHQLLDTQQYWKTCRLYVQYVSLVDYCSCLDYFTGW